MYIRVGGAMIETKGLRKSFRVRKATVDAVRGVDLSVREGEIFGFLGPNGAGKTTTLRMLATLLPPTGGEAAVGGADLRREPRTVRRRVGYVGQRTGSDPAVAGRAELEFQGRLYGLPAAEARRRAAELLAMLDLEPCAGRPTATTSITSRTPIAPSAG